MLDQFSATVELMYAAAIDARRWDDALRAVESLTASAGAVIDLVPRDAGVAPKTIAGSFGLDECATYARDYMAICRRIRFCLDHPQGTQYDYLFMTEREMDLDPVYEWFGSYGLRYYIGSWAGQTPSYNATISLQRSRRQGHATEEDLALFNLLKPHAMRALALADQLGALHSAERLGSSIAESLRHAVFGVDAEGRVVHLNSAARALLAGSSAARLVGGRLEVARADDQARLDRLIAEAARDGVEASGGWTRISRPDCAAPYAVFVAPLRTQDDDFATTGVRAAVIVHDPAARLSPEPAILASVYDLTDTEARLASAIAGGHSIESAAASLHMQVATARSHLKSIFTKLGVNRQQDLVRLLTSLSTMKL